MPAPKFLLLKTLWLCLLLGLSQFMSAQTPVNRLQQYLDSISIPQGLKTISICDSVLRNHKLPAKDKGIFYRIKARAYYFQADYKSAGINYDLSLKFLTKDEYETGLTLIEQARLYRKLKMFDEAIEVYAQAETIFKKLDDKNNVATVLNEWGVVYEMMENYPEAIRFYNRSLKLKEALKDTIGIAYSNSFLSGAYFLLNDLEKSKEYNLKALELFKKLNDPYRMASLYTDMARIYEKEKNFDKAISLLKNSEKVAFEMNNKDLLSQNQFLLAELFAKQSNFQNAYQYYKQYSNIKDSIFLETSQRTIADLNVQYQTADKNKRIAEQQKNLMLQKWLLALSLILLIAVSAATALIIRNKKLREAKIISEAKYKEDLLKMEARNELQRDRLRISKDLHDNIGSYLTYINAAINNDDLELSTLRQTTLESISELRRTVWLINRQSVTVEEWIVKLREYHLKLKAVAIASEVEDPEFRLSAVQATELFRIIQEAVNNAVKYADASVIKIIVVQKAGQISITVDDDGNGFDLENHQSGFGLKNMRQRIESIGGTFEIHSQIKKGTTIKVEATLKN